jgi:hypothetical protein
MIGLFFSPEFSLEMPICFIFLKLANKHFGNWFTAITFAVRIFYKPK